MNSSETQPGPSKPSVARFLEQATLKYESVLFAARYVLTVMYAGLFVALVCYAVFFVVRTVPGLVLAVFSMDPAQAMAAVLEASDQVMVGNLLFFVMVTSYTIFVRPLHVQGKQNWLNKANNATIKISMGLSLIGVSSVGLLQCFIAAEQGHIDWHLLSMKLAIHVVLVFSTYFVAKVWLLEEQATKIAAEEEEIERTAHASEGGKEHGGEHGDRHDISKLPPKVQELIRALLAETAEHKTD